jgi:nucleoside-diphosphate-sugar epimerase
MKYHLDKIKNAKVLITGGLGFVGNNLARTLVNDYGCNVLIVDDCSNSTIDTISDISDKVEFHQISVIDTDKLFPLFDGVEYIFHLACKQISASGGEPILDLKVNAESVLQILLYIKYNPWDSFKRFIYTSSCSVYGSQKNLPAEEEGVTKVLSNYAATKLLGENYTLIYNKQHNVSTSSVRYSNVYGYGQSPKNPYCGVLGIFIHNALTNKPLTVIGDGEQTRDYTFISDAVDGTILAAVHPRAYGEVYNVGTSIETSVNNLVDIIDLYVKDIEIKYIPERDIDNIRRRSVAIEKIHEQLNWSPKFNIKRGIEETIKWYDDFLKKA